MAVVPDHLWKEQELLSGLADVMDLVKYDFEGALIRGLCGIFSEPSEEETPTTCLRELHVADSAILPPLPPSATQAIPYLQNFFVDHPNDKVLFVTCDDRVKDVSTFLQMQLTSQPKILECLDGRFLPKVLEGHQIMILPNSAAEEASRGLHLSAFGLLLLDCGPDEGQPLPTLRMWREKWMSLPAAARPKWLDLSATKPQAASPSSQHSDPCAEGHADQTMQDVLNALGKERRHSELTGSQSSESDQHLSFGPSENGSDLAGAKDLPKFQRPKLCHPYVHHTGAEVNIFNCVAIFMSFCKATLGADFNTTQIFEYRRPVGQPADVLHSVQYRSPQGMTSVTKEQVDKAWDGMSLNDFVDHRQIAGLRDIDRQKIQFVYPVVLDMIQKGYLNEYNKPSPVILAACGASCHHQSDPMVDTPSPLSFSAFPVPIAPPSSSAPPSKTVAPWPQNKDPKSLLNELKHKLNLLIAYDTISVWPRLQTSGYQCTLYLKCNGEMIVFRGEVCNGKKVAEQSAAMTAVQFITSGGLEGATVPGLQGHMVQRSRIADTPPQASSSPDAKKSTLSENGGWDPHAEIIVSGAPSPSVTTPTAQLKGLLQAMGYGHRQSPTLHYTPQAVPGGWQAIVQIHMATGDGCRFVGGLAATKAEAQELAAWAALHQLFSTVQ